MRFVDRDNGGCMDRGWPMEMDTVREAVIPSWVTKGILSDRLKAYGTDRDMRFISHLCIRSRE